MLSELLCGISRGLLLKIKENLMNTICIMRGLPGSGKTFLATSLSSARIASADDWFRDLWTGQYEYNAAQIQQAHAYCMGRAEAFMALDVPLVVVDNTNVRLAHMAPYLNMAERYGYAVRVLIPNTPWAHDPAQCHARCQHGVPLEVIKRLHAEFEADNLVAFGSNTELSQPVGSWQVK
jgi:predicted kinase